ncbi:HAD-IIIC family phosphatase [Candidatus Rickettsiella viridis]|uniref:HAD-IIIC family phosphatase n=1 Tax=Candidatus Rickettsiella viridis TaxID=676208 RepID=UPI000F844026|nr:HAD-IIIC family phosphatase [Candidatus Rickettsiella viridis]
MIILSSFNSDYLRNPLQFLIDQFMEDEKVVVNYGNIITSLLALKKDKENQIVTVLFRLTDLVNYTAGAMDLLQKNLQLVIDTVDTVKRRLSARVMVVLCPSLESGLPNLQPLEKSFYEAMQEKAIPFIKVADIQSYYSLTSIENKVGKETHIPYTPEFYIALSCAIVRKLHNLISKPYKVIAIDCDDTLWQGVVGDIGAKNVEFKKHHHSLHELLIKLNEAGIVICVISKNDPQNVYDVFEKRFGDIKLKREIFAKLKINWQLKSQNIYELSKELGLGVDSFVFIDDSRFELEEVRRNLPEVLCIKAPQNEEEFFALQDNWVFDAKVTSTEDANRTKLYKEDEKRQDYQSNFSNYIQFLQAINLSILIDEVKENQEETIKRISILSAKTNQFNLFPLLQDIADIKNSLKDNKIIFNARASDDFGDYGLIAVAFCHIQDKSLLVDSFFVSCRAFKKGIEYHFIKHIAQYAVDRSLDKIDLRFKKTEKNKVAQSFVSLLLQKCNIPFGYIYQAALGEETNIIFSSAQLAILDVNNLLESQNGTHDEEIVPNSVVKKHSYGDLFNKNDYLTKLQRLTRSLDFLLDKFFFDERKLLSLTTIESKVFTLCHYLLGDVQNDIALIHLGLDSLKATELSYYLFQITDIDVSITLLLDRATTLQTLISYIGQQKYSGDQGFGTDQEDSLEEIDDKLSVSKYDIKKEDDSGESSLDSLECVVKKTAASDYSLDSLAPSKFSQIMSTSFQQKRIWLAEKKEINHDNPSSNYIMVACFSISNLQIPRFKQACERLIKRHDAFGCSFVMRDKELVQTILPAEDRQTFFEVIPVQDELSVEAAILKKAKESFLMSDEPLK